MGIGDISACTMLNIRKGIVGNSTRPITELLVRKKPDLDFHIDQDGYSKYTVRTNKTIFVSKFSIFDVQDSIEEKSSRVFVTERKFLIIQIFLVIRRHFGP